MSESLGNGAASAGIDEVRQRVMATWRVIWRGKLLILSCWVIALVPTLLYLSQAPRQYTANAKVVIEGPEASEMLSDRSVPRMRLTESTVLTEAEVVASNVLARRVINRLNLDQDPEFNARLRKPKPILAVLASLNPLSWLGSLAGQLGESDGETLSATARSDIQQAAITKTFLSKLKVTPERRTYVLTISFTAESREKAALIANTLSELYVTDRLEAGFDEARRVSGWLTERLDTLRRDALTADAAAERFRAENNLRRKGDRQNTINDQQMLELNSRLALARSDLAQRQARLSQIRTLLRTNGGVETAADVLQSPLIQRLREQEAQILREMSEALKIYGDRHPRIVSFRADVGELQAKISSEIHKIAQSLANEVDVASVGVASLEREVDGLRRQGNQAGEAEVRLRELERQAEAGRTLYESLLARFKRDAEQERVQRANARIIANAGLPTIPSAPRSMVILMAVSGGALGLGLLLVLVLDRLDNAVRSSDEAEDLTGLPTLSMLPSFNSASDRLPDELSQRPRSALADAVRSLKVTLDAGDERGSQITLMTSSMPKEGKTYASLCLSSIFAMADQRVLLIDADLHRPRMHSALGLDAQRGLAHILAGQATLDDVLVTDVIPGLDFLPAGQMDRVADLVSESQINQMLADLRHRYDRIVIDSPPVLAISDVRILARSADRVIYLIKWNSTPRDAIRTGLKLLKEVHVNVHGTILSQVNQRKHARYAYGDYGQYYGRYREYYGK